MIHVLVALLLVTGTTFISALRLAVSQVGERHGAGNVNNLPPEIRFALEMALHEDVERRAMQGELAELESEWRLAEEVAHIADNLTIGADVLTALDRLKTLF